MLYAYLFQTNALVLAFDSKQLALCSGPVYSSALLRNWRLLRKTQYNGLLAVIDISPKRKLLCLHSLHIQQYLTGLTNSNRRRVFPDPILRKILFATAFIVIALWICSMTVTIFECTPVAAAWDFELEGAKCIDLVTFFYVASAINGITDVVLCVAPLPLVYRLQTSVKEKALVSFLFGAGVLVSFYFYSQPRTRKRFTR